MQKELGRLREELKSLRAEAKAGRGPTEVAKPAGERGEDDEDEKHRKELEDLDVQLRGMRAAAAAATSPSQAVLDTIEALDAQKQAKVDELRAKKPVLTQLLGLQRKHKAKQEAIEKQDAVVVKAEAAVVAAQQALEERAKAKALRVEAVELEQKVCELTAQIPKPPDEKVTPVAEGPQLNLEGLGALLQELGASGDVAERLLQHPKLEEKVLKRAGVVRPAPEGAPGGAGGSKEPDPKRIMTEADSMPIEQLRTSFVAAGLDVPSEEAELRAMAHKMASASRWAYQAY